MSVIYLLLPLALGLGAVFAVGFLRMVSQGQYDELETPAHRILLDDEAAPSSSKTREVR
jgi:cbb3-type cytochrome oxidase maturation protein